MPPQTRIWEGPAYIQQRDRQAEILRHRRYKLSRRRRRNRIFTKLLFSAALIALGVFIGRAGRAEKIGTEAACAPYPGKTVTASTEIGWPDETPESERQEIWELVLVNQNHPLSEDFVAASLTEVENGYFFDSRAAESLRQMLKAAREAGLQPLICSAYRTGETQQELYQNKIDSLLEQGLTPEDAEAEAAVWVAPPGTSEHETGLAVDIVDINYQLLDELQEQTPVQKWLVENCAEYGFILRYPVDKTELTGIGYEPWHFRYVGKTAAEERMAEGICLEEYLEG